MTRTDTGNSPMKLQFSCPEKGLVFESSDFRIIENKGIRSASDGSRTLEAEVLVEEACPHCGKKHRYRISEIACPFHLS